MSHPPITIRAFGVDWRLHLDEETDASYAQLCRLWARCTVPDDPTAPPFVVWRKLSPERGTAAVMAPYAQDDVPYVISRAITAASITRQTGKALMLHAAGLASSDHERFVALVAPSGTGKSTAARTLGREFGYVSDETIALTEDLIALPYPKPISIIRPGGEPYEKTEEGADEFGLRATPPAPRLTASVVLRRDPACSVPRLVESDLIDGVLALIEQSSAIPALSAPLDWLARAASAGGGPYELHYAEITDCAPIIHGLLESLPPQPLTWVIHTPPEDQFLKAHMDDAVVEHDETPPATRPVHEDDLVVRAPWTDAIGVEGDLLVLQGSLPIRIRGVGESAWLACAQPRRAGDLVQPVIDALGAHPDAKSLVLNGLTLMVGAKVLHRLPADR